MPYDADSLRANLRNMFINLGPDLVPDHVMTTYLVQGLRRLSTDRPNEIITTFAAQSEYDYALNGVGGLISDWVEGFSTIRGVQPTYVAGSKGYQGWLRYGTDYLIQTINGISSLHMTDKYSSSGLTVRYTMPWFVNGLEDSLVTTITMQLQNSLELACASAMARAMAAKSAGTIERSVPADLVSWRNKQREYSFQARDWEQQYWLSIGYNKDGAPPPVMIAIDFDYTHSDGYSSVTHEEY